MKRKYIILIIILIIYIIYTDKCNIENFTTKPKFIEKIPRLSNKQYIFKKSLEDMSNILEKNNIKFFLFCGTALGAHREGTFIEHDEDIDLGFFEQDNSMKNIIDLVNKDNRFKIDSLFPQGIKVADEITEVSFIHKKTGIKVDIFKLIKKKNNYVYYTYNNICNQKKHKRCEYINPIKLQDIIFFNRKYKIPGIDFLVSNYGDDWEILKKFTYEEGLKTHYKSMTN